MDNSKFEGIIYLTKTKLAKILSDWKIIITPTVRLFTCLPQNSIILGWLIRNLFLAYCTYGFFTCLPQNSSRTMNETLFVKNPAIGPIEDSTMSITFEICL